jgi:hypothetical protein
LRGSFRSAAYDLLNAQIPDRRQIQFRIVDTLRRKFNILCSLHSPFTIPRSLAVSSQVDCRRRKFLFPPSKSDERDQRTEDGCAATNTNPDNNRIKKQLDDWQDYLLILPLIDCETA